MGEEKVVKKKKLSKLLRKGVAKKCPTCKGRGKEYGHGAFGEPESYVCSRCVGFGYVLNIGNIDKEK